MQERTVTTEPGSGMPGITIRHTKACPTNSGGSCNAGERDGCRPSWRVKVYDQLSKRWAVKAFRWTDYGSVEKALKAAKGWQTVQRGQVLEGIQITKSRKSLRDVAEQWLAGVKASPPTITNRSGEAYKPSALRGLEADLKRYVLPELGAHRIAEIRRSHVQAFIDRLNGTGLSGAKVRSIILALRVVCRYADERELIASNPTTGVRLPKGSEPSERAASVIEAAELLAALPDKDRPLWATAFYAGLRRGELRGLRWEDVDLAEGEIHVHRSWDPYAGEIAPKSKKGTRRVPVAAMLRDYLIEQKVRTGGTGRDFVFPGLTNDRPFTPTSVRKRALTAWRKENKRRTALAEEQGATPKLLSPIGLHQCRHSFVSLMHDMGFSLEQIGDYVGHSSTYMTDRYRHLLEGHGAEARSRMDAYYTRADTSARLDQLAELEGGEEA